MTSAIAVACPGCGADIAPQLTLYEVYESLPSARTGAPAAVAPSVVCAACGKESPIDAPRLLRIADLALPLVFVAAQGTTDTEDRAHLAALTEIARAACGVKWRDEWTWRMWFVVRHQLADLLSQNRLLCTDVPNGLMDAARALAEAANWPAVIGIVSGTPALLSHEADGLYDEYLAYAMFRGNETRDLVADRDVLRRFRAHGIDAIADAHLAHEPAELAAEFAQLRELAATLDAHADPQMLNSFRGVGEALITNAMMREASTATRRAVHEQLVTASRAGADDAQREAAERRTWLASGITHQQHVVRLAVLCDLAEVVKAQNTLGNMYQQLSGLGGNGEQLDCAIAAWRAVLERDPSLSIRDSQMAMSNLGSALRTRFRRVGVVQDLHESIAMHERVVQATEQDDVLAHMRLNNLANALITRFQFAGDVADIAHALRLWTAALEHLPDAQRDEGATYLGHIASAYHMRYHATGALDDLERAVDYQRNATQASDPASQQYVYRLQSLGHATMSRYSVSNDVQDLYATIRLYEEALERTLPDAPERPAVLSDVASGLLTRYQHQDKLTDLQQALALYREALAGLPQGHVDRDNLLMQFGLALTLAYERRGDVGWLDEAIMIYREASALAPPPARALTFRRLGDVLRTRSALAAPAATDADEGRAALRTAIDSGTTVSPHEAMRAAESLGDWLARDGVWAEAASVFATGLTCADAMFDAQGERRTRETLVSTLPALAARAAYASARAGNAGDAACLLERVRTRLLLGDLSATQPGAAQAQPTEASPTIDELLAVPPHGDALVYLSTSAYGGLGVLIANGGVETFAVDLDDASLATLMLRRKPWNDMTPDEQFKYGGDTIRYVQFGSAAAAIGAHAAALSAFRVNEIAGDAYGTGQDRRPVIGGLLGAHMGVVSLESALDDMFKAIGQRLAAPLAAAILEHSRTGGVIDRIVVIACGMLSYVPVHAAPFARNNSMACVLDDVDVVYAPSARVFATAHARCNRTASALVVVAEPRPETHGLPLGTLEATLVQSTFGAASSIMLIGGDAVSSAVQQAVRGATHVHLATHGVFHPDAPLTSSIELAEEDELTLDAMAAARLFDGVQLVTFSACETALSDARFLPDEGLGLPSAAIRAGAACVIGALWSVREMPTVLLMGRLYAALADPDVTPSGALRAAQQWLREVTVSDLIPTLREHVHRADQIGAGRELVSQLIDGLRAVPDDMRPFAHPQHWAAWIATGG